MSKDAKAYNECAKTLEIIAKVAERGPSGEEWVNKLLERDAHDKEIRRRMDDLGVTTREDLLTYAEVLEQTVVKTAEVLFDICDGYSPFDLMDITGFSLEKCEEMKEMANNLPKHRDHVKDFVRKVTG